MKKVHANYNSTTVILRNPLGKVKESLADTRETPDKDRQTRLEEETKREQT